jgi:putative oxidoreductase
MELTVTTPAPKWRIARLYEGFTQLLTLAEPLFGLAARLYVAKVFFTSGLLKFQRWDSTLALFENEYHVPLLSPYVAALSGTAAELMLPVLLALGIGTRAAALALFAVNVVAAISYPDLSDAGLKDHFLWGTLLLVVAVYGPGRLSVDRWLGVR